MNESSHKGSVTMESRWPFPRSHIWQLCFVCVASIWRAGSRHFVHAGWADRLLGLLLDFKNWTQSQSCELRHQQLARTA